MKKKHIVIDARIRPASTGRPVDRLLEQLQLQDDTYIYTVIVGKKDDWKPKAKHMRVVRTRFPIFSFTLLNQLLSAKQLYSLKPDLVYFTLTPQQPLFYFGKQITLTHDLTMLNYVRAGRLPAWAHALRMRGYRLLLWSAHRRAKHIIVPSDYVKDAITKYHLFTNRKTTRVYEASDGELGGKPLEPENPPKNFIVHVGSPFPHKNIERLVEAFGLLKEHHADLSLVLVGKQEYYFKKLEAWARQKPYADALHFTGFVPDAELKWYYQNAKAYVLPALSEGFGLPGLEAMAHGCPVVSSNATCLPEIYGSAAHYFDPEDIHDIAKSIDEVLSSPQLQQKLVTAGTEQLKNYSWSKWAKGNLEVIKKSVD
mgnify:CR=1 FL=1